MSLRDDLLARLRTQSFDILVIGGGIIGAGIARDASMRGLRVALVEQGDFAGGASSKTSKLIHGGLRYLEHGRLRLVSESLRERRTLLTIAPQVVWPTRIMIPSYKGDARSPWAIRAGLTFYDLLAGSSNLQRHSIHSSRAALRKESQLKPDGLRSAAMYSDCQMDDARLCLANVLQAVSFGGVAVNYLKVLTLRKASGALHGAIAQDLRSGEQFGIQASLVINATGPWSDAIRRMSDPHAQKRLAPTKGIHLIVRRLSSMGLYLPSCRDRRMIFALPYGEHTLIGTTESPIADLDHLRATSNEVDYLLDTVSRALPGASLKASDILGTFAGARPLLAHSGPSTSASREHQLEVDEFGMISVLGGKFTTYRAIAKQAVDCAIERGRFRSERCLTDQVALLEPVHPVVLERWQAVTRHLAPELLARLLTVYGSGALPIMELIEADAKLAQPICPHHDVLHAEILYAMRGELACTISDVLLRRTRVGHSLCQGLDSLSSLKDLLNRQLHLSRPQIEQQVNEYHATLADSVAFRSESLGRIPDGSRSPLASGSLAAMPYRNGSSSTHAPAPADARSPRKKPAATR